ncbi:MAG: oxidoreductase [Chloroflexota bacterium]|nr:(2Fe-2S)-binding protein [Chloroflexota bacterium]NOG63276.1 (2Fe-2S)-binding protein [Chloroflexota bacterium]GIK64535.1 MAG: oxidoreductase [Chloroflexota bacterium]
MESITVTFKLNGKTTAVAIEPLESLRTVLREHLHLHATKAGCGQGGCGSCTVLVNDEPVLSCLMLAALADGQEVTTLEGIGTPPHMHPLQTAFFDRFAAQCGYCSPGMIMAAKALLDKNPHPTRAEIAEALAGNLCRCTGYVAILDAIEDVVTQMQEA